MEASIRAWAAEAGCSEINLESSSNFARVWLVCIAIAVTLGVFVALPYLWCAASLKKQGDPKKLDELDDDADDPETAQEDGRVVSNVPGSARSRAASGKLKHLPGEPEIAQGNEQKLAAADAWQPGGSVGQASNLEGVKPDLEAARKHLRKTSCTDECGNWRPVFGTSLEQIGEFGGPGMELYFRLLRYLGFCFIYMALITSPTVAFSLHGSFAPDTGNSLVMTTVGNLGEKPTGGLLAEARLALLGCQGLELKMLTKWFGWLDLAATCLILGLIVITRFRWIPEAEQAADDASITCSDFAIEIDGLPAQIPDHVAYKAELTAYLKEHLEQARDRHQSSKQNVLLPLEVCELSLVRDYDQRLHAIRNRARLLQDMRIMKDKIAMREEQATSERQQKRDHARLESLTKKVDKLSGKLERELQPEEQLPVVRAYAILNTTYDVTNLLVDFRFTQSFVFRCCQSKAQRFHGHTPKIRRAPEPTNIIWENQDTGHKERYLRMAAVGLVVVIVIAISTGVGYLLNVAGHSQTESTHSYIGQTTCDPSGHPDSAAYSENPCLVQNVAGMPTATAVLLGGDTLSCYCATVGYSDIVTSDVVRDACSDWLWSAGTSLAIVSVTAVSVTLINIVTKELLGSIAHYERPVTVSALNCSAMLKVFVAQTLNTSIVIFWVNFWAPQALRTISVGIPMGTLIFRGPFSDFVRGWYTVVGAAILMNMATNAFVPALTNVSVMLLLRLRRWYSRGSVMHQLELQKLYTNRSFDMSKKMAHLLTTVFCTLIYSSGLPLLNLFAAAYMFLTYWSDKFVLLRGSSRPPLYDSIMAVKATQYMIYAVALHCVFGVCMLGQPCVFPSDPVGGSLGSLNQQAASAGVSSGFFDWMWHRISRESTWLLFALLLLITAGWTLWLIQWLLGKTFGGFLVTLVSLCFPKRADKKASASRGDLADAMGWEAAAAHLEQNALPASYALSKNLGFEDREMFLQSVQEPPGSLPAEPPKEGVPIQPETSPGGDAGHPGPPAALPGSLSGEPPLAATAAGGDSAAEEE